MIEKAARDHPYHVTIIIMALCNVEKESEVPTAGTALRRSTLSRKEASAKTNGTDQVRLFPLFMISNWTAHLIVVEERQTDEKGIPLVQFLIRC